MSFDPHNAEYLAAVAALPGQTISHRVFAAGQTVRCPKAFANGYQVGTVVDRVTDRHWGECYRVDTPEGRLLCLTDELEVI